MKQPEDYLGQARAALQRIDRRLDEVELQLKSKTIQGGMQVRAKLDDLRKKRAAVGSRVQAAREEGAEAWKRIRWDLEELRNDFSQAFSGVVDELKSSEQDERQLEEAGHGRSS